MNNLTQFWQDYIARFQQLKLNDTYLSAGRTFPPAASENILAIEKHYNINLPKSYKALLNITNGMGFLGFDGYDRLYPIEKVTLFKHYEPELFEIIESDWIDKGKWSCLDKNYFFFYNKNKQIVDINGKLTDYPPRDSFFYDTNGNVIDIQGNKVFHMPENSLIDDKYVWDSMHEGLLAVRHEYLNHLILIGEANAGVFNICINPCVKTQSGEYEVWAIDHRALIYKYMRYINFQELMEHFLNSMIDFRES